MRMGGAMELFDVKRYREDFPLLKQESNGKPLAYLDNAATTQKPRAVIDAVKKYYEEGNANIHRGIYALSQHATKAYEASRQKVQRFLNAARPEEIIFVRGTTEAINLVAQTYGKRHLGPGDEVLISAMEHHSNIVPWQILCDEVGAKLRVIPVTDRGGIVMAEYEKLLSERTKLVSIVHVSNSIGTINPIHEMIQRAHERGIPVLVDGAQSAPHIPIDVQALDCDFFCFSGHKMYGPTGVGVLYGKQHLLEEMPPYQGGGDMIRVVTFEKSLYNSLPFKFEAGTPNIAGVIGLGAAIDYLESVGIEKIVAYERSLLRYATETLSSKVEGIRLIGTAPQKTSIISFVLDVAHPHDVGTVLDQEGIAVRAGHHCTMPLMDRFGVPATTRASFVFYNTTQEIDRLVEAIAKTIQVFK
jgi:cysteine desulfurase / selenocysteine lyase